MLDISRKWDDYYSLFFHVSYESSSSCTRGEGDHAESCMLACFVRYIDLRNTYDLRTGYKMHASSKLRHFNSSPRCFMQKYLYMADLTR